MIGPPNVYPKYGDNIYNWAPGRYKHTEFLEVWQCWPRHHFCIHESLNFSDCCLIFIIVVGSQSRELHQEHFNLSDTKFWCCGKYQCLEFSNASLSVSVSRWSKVFDIQQDLFTTDWCKITYVIQVSFSALVISATHTIYVWCLTMFLLQCHLDKRSLSRFYTPLCSSNQLESLCSYYVVMKTQCVSLFIAQTIVFKSKHIRLDLDCTVASTWCEIDAVKIDGNSGICPECMLHPLSLIVIQIENMMLPKKFSVNSLYL